MTRLKPGSKCLLTALAVLMFASLSAEAAEDKFVVAIGPNNDFVDGEGTGYNDGKWYFYSNTNWWNQWFYNGPYDAERMKEIEVSLKIGPVNPKEPVYAQIAYNWSSPEWSALGKNRPPLPEDVQDEKAEDKYIKRTIFRIVQLQAGSLPISISHNYQIQDYNPEWVSIDVRGSNFEITSGWIKHECVPKDNQPQACCLPDGTCVDTLPSSCQQMGGTPQGVGTSCQNIVCPQPLQACCLSDGTCIDANEADCISQGGVPQGAGTNCNTAVCPGPEKPDLLITDISQSAGQICYQMVNIGQATAPKGYHTALFVDGELVTTDLVDTELGPGQGVRRCFDYDWQCTSQNDTITVCADCEDFVDESNEENNCVEETWQCDTTPPRIIDGPIVSKLTETSCIVLWTTDEESDSTVKFGDRAGKYNYEEHDPKLIPKHEVALTDLKPSTVYHYIVQSSDASDNTVTSREGFFETASLPDSEPPIISSFNIIRGEGDFEYWKIPASTSDNIGVDRVEFYLDGQLIGIDYSHPYLCYLVPSYMQMARDELFGPHTIEAFVIDESGMVMGGSTPFNPPYEVMDVFVDISRPCMSPPPCEHQGYLYTDDGAVPDGTIVEIQAHAREYEWRENGPVLEPEVPGAMPPPPPPGIYVPHTVRRVEFYVNGHWQGTCRTHSDCFETIYGDYVYTYPWDAGGLGVGDYDIEARAIATDGRQATTECTVTVVPGSPILMLHRSVSRNDNYFVVTLTLSNPGTASARVDTITDNLIGFQAVRETAENYAVSTDYSDATESCQVVIDLFTATTDTVTLGPGEPFSVEYSIVPILYLADDTPYSIGDEETIVRYYDPSGESHDYSASWPCSSPGCRIDGEWFSDSLDHATGQADYLIVTTPRELFSLYIDADVQELLSTMASLAKDKTGVLGYLPFPTRARLRNAMLPGGTWSSRLSSGWTSGGYLLIVGETEIVPSKEIWDSGISDATDHWRRGPVYPVPLVDNWYADISGSDNLPDLIVGRIVGDSASQLDAVIQTSLLDQFDRTDALVFSGTDSGNTDAEASFENNADEVADLLDDEFTVVLRHGSDYASYAARLAEFRNQAQDKDVIFWRDHGSRNCWSHTVCEPNFPVNFGTSYPFAFAAACWTGNYEDTPDNDYCVGEAFLDSGTGVYIGATERSPRAANNNAGKKFFTKWVGSSDCIGQAFRDTKRELGTSDSYKRLWVFEYNLYGDPKYGASAAAASSPAAFAKDVLAQPLSSLKVAVPNYQVTQVEGVDYVEIPGGELLLVPDKPAVPFYVASVDYPEGYQVQDVILTDRSGLVTATGLNLPVVSMEQGEDASGGSESSAESTTSSWYPEEDYHWRVLENPDGSTTLVILMYPFYYNSSTTDVKFYKDYSFGIDYIFSTVEITSLTTDKDAYRQGDDVLVDFRLNNPGEAQDVIVNATVRAEGSGQLVDGLLLHSLKGLRGFASFSPYWDSDGIEPGYYYVEGTLNDTSGDVLDRRTKIFRLGICSGELTEFSATPEYARIGEDVTTNMTFVNTGTVNITGSARIRVLNSTGGVIDEFAHGIADLSPAESVSFSDVWSVSKEGPCKVVGYVLYDGKSTDPATAEINKCGNQRFEADISHDCYVNLTDVALIGSQWLEGTCSDPVWCDGADIDKNGKVDLRDGLVLAHQWLWCNDPANPQCD